MKTTEVIVLDPEVIVLDPEAFDAFVELLDRPAQEKPRLRRLLRDPSIADPTDHYEENPA